MGCSWSNNIITGCLKEIKRSRLLCVSAFYDRMKIEKAMLTFHEQTCVRFVPRSTEVDYLSLENGRG